MSKYTSSAAVTRDQDIEDTLLDYLGESRPKSNATTSKVSTSQPQGRAQNVELKGTPADMILQLNDYKEKGLISDQQFQEMKKQILGI